MQAVYISYLSTFLKKLIVNYKEDDINVCIKSGLLMLENVEFECDFFNSFIFPDSPKLKIVSATSSYIKLKIPSLLKLNQEALEILLGIVNIEISVSENNGSGAKSIAKNESKSYGFSQRLVDEMGVKLESLNITITLDSTRKNAAEMFKFKLYFFNSTICCTDRNFTPTARKNLDNKLGRFILIHRVLKSSFSCAELYYKKVGETELRHIVLFDNQSIDAFMIVKKSQKNEKLSVITALEMNEFAIKINMIQLEVVSEFLLALIDASKKQKNVETAAVDDESGRTENADFFDLLKSLHINSDRNLFASPSFLSPPVVDLEKINVNSKSIFIKSLLVYLVDENAEGSKRGRKSDLPNTQLASKLGVPINTFVENDETFPFIYKVFLENISFGSTTSKEHSIFAQDTPFPGFSQVITSGSVGNASFFCKMENSSLCLFSTFWDVSAENDSGDGNSNGAVSAEKPVHYWQLSKANFLSIKVCEQFRLNSKQTPGRLMDVRLGKVDVLFDPKWKDVASKAKNVAKVQLEALQSSYKERRKSRDALEAVSDVIGSIKGRIESEGKGIACKIKRFVDDIVFRIHFDRLRAVAANQETQIAEFTLEKVQFCNHNKLYNSAWKRSLVSSELNFSDGPRAIHSCFEFSVGETSFAMDENNIALRGLRVGYYKEKRGEKIKKFFLLGSEFQKAFFKESNVVKPEFLKEYLHMAKPHLQTLADFAKKTKYFEDFERLMRSVSESGLSWERLKSSFKDSKESEELIDVVKSGCKKILDTIYTFRQTATKIAVSQEIKLFMSIGTVNLMVYGEDQICKNLSFGEGLVVLISEPKILYVRASAQNVLAQSNGETKIDQTAVLLSIYSEKNGPLDRNFSVTVREEIGAFEEDVSELRTLLSSGALLSGAAPYVQLPLTPLNLESAVETQKAHIKQLEKVIERLKAK